MGVPASIVDLRLEASEVEHGREGRLAEALGSGKALSPFETIEERLEIESDVRLVCSAVGLAIRDRGSRGAGEANENGEPGARAKSRSDDAEAVDKSSASGIVLVHSLPQQPWTTDDDQALVSLAMEVHRKTGFAVIVPRLRGVGESSGDFSISGWCRDIVAALGVLESSLEARVGEGGRTALYGIGFGIGGSCLLSVAAGDSRLDAVACVSVPPELADLPVFKGDFFSKARSWGLVRSADFPKEAHKWRRELIAFAPLHHARRLKGRPVLLVCREGDRFTAGTRLERLASAVGPSCETVKLSKTGPAQPMRNRRAIDVACEWLRERAEERRSAGAAL